MAVCIIYKKSVYQKYIESKKSPHLAKLYYAKHPLTRRFHSAHQNHSQTLMLVRKILKKYQLPFDELSRKNIGSLKGYDLIITVGGDGTFLKASHHVRDELMLGINSAPKASVGALLTTNAQTFENRLRLFIEAKNEIRILQRIDIRINGKLLATPALNDILLSHQSPAGVCRYLIKVGKEKEEQRSSGLWVATGVGSTAGIAAAGGTKQKPTDARIQYRVREAIRRGPLKLLKGFLQKGESLNILNQTIDATLFIDGVQTPHPLLFGDQISLTLSTHPLRIVV